jgi:hypothetical protein
MHQSFEKSARGKHHGTGANTLTVLDSHADNGTALDNEIYNLGLHDKEAVRGLNHPLHATPVKGFVSLRSRGLHGRAFARIEATKLDTAFVDRAAHFAAQGINLAYEMPFSDAADRGVTRHLPDVVEIECQNERARSGARRRQCCLDAGVSGTHYDNVETGVHEIASAHTLSTDRQRILHESDRSV